LAHLSSFFGALEGVPVSVQAVCVSTGIPGGAQHFFFP